jgi:Protein kinase domain
METSATRENSAGDLSEIGGYEVIRRFVPGQSWLAVAPGGRKVVLKILDEDCLWKGQLHPNIKDRLGRVRELAHAGVANLYGVERDENLTYMVWEYVEGRTLADVAAAPTCGQRDLLVLARDLVLGVEMMHARGIVHGAVNASNAIVDADGRVVITHVSPLLYGEPTEDLHAVLRTLRQLVEERGESDSPLGRLLDAVDADANLTLRRLAARLGALIESRESEPAVVESDAVEAKRIRRRALWGAAATALLALALFAGFKEYASAKTPKPPVPPPASPAAMQPPARGENPSATAGWSGRRIAP